VGEYGTTGRRKQFERLSIDMLNDDAPTPLTQLQVDKLLKRMKKLEEELTLILSQICNYDSLSDLKVIARSHAMSLGIKIVEKDSK
jgi:hypothetical protein